MTSSFHLILDLADTGDTFTHLAKQNSGSSNTFDFFFLAKLWTFFDVFESFESFDVNFKAMMTEIMNLQNFYHTITNQAWVAVGSAYSFSIQTPEILDRLYVAFRT